MNISMLKYIFFFILLLHTALSQSSALLDYVKCINERTHYLSSEDHGKFLICDEPYKFDKKTCSCIRDNDKGNGLILINDLHEIGDEKGPKCSPKFSEQECLVELHQHYPTCFMTTEPYDVVRKECFQKAVSNLHKRQIEKIFMMQSENKK